HFLLDRAGGGGLALEQKGRYGAALTGRKAESASRRTGATTAIAIYRRYPLSAAFSEGKSRPGEGAQRPRQKGGLAAGRVLSDGCCRGVNGGEKHGRERRACTL